jgi:hypothetical protein
MKEDFKPLLRAIFESIDCLGPIRPASVELILLLRCPELEQMSRVRVQTNLDVFDRAQQLLRDGGTEGFDVMEALKAQDHMQKINTYSLHVIEKFQTRFSEYAARASALSDSEAAALMDDVSSELNPVVTEVITSLRQTYVELVAMRAERENTIVKNGLDSVSRVGREIQTIAINAAIEAARVGPLGRGFAIISQEIRGLSESSEKSISELNRLLAPDS